MLGRFILELWYYYCTVIVEITQNTKFLQSTCFKECNNMVVRKALTGNDKILRKISFSYHIE